MRDFYSGTNIRNIIPPALIKDNTAISSLVIDTKAQANILLGLLIGAIEDTDAVFSLSIFESNAPSMANASAVPSARVLNNVSSFSAIHSDTVIKMLVLPEKRYLRITITPSNNSAAAMFALFAQIQPLSYFPAVQEVITYTLIDTPLNICVFSDSIGNQNHTGTVGGSILLEAYGYLNAFNVLMGQRFGWKKALNLGSSGQNTAGALLNLSQITDAYNNQNARILVVQLGTNDTGATIRIPPETSNSNLDLIIAHGRSLGMEIWILPDLPRSSWVSVNESDIPQRKADRLVINAHLESLDDDQNIYFISGLSDAFDDGTGAPKADYTHDGLHPLHMGAFVIGTYMKNRFEHKYSAGTWPTKPNLLSTSQALLAGSGGTLNTGTSGIVPTGFSLNISSAGTKTCVGSRNADGSYRITATITGGSTNDTATLKIADVTGMVGGSDILQAFADCRYVSQSKCMGGPIRFIEKTSGGSQINAHIALDKRNTEEAPMQLYGRCLFASDPVQAHANTAKADFEIRIPLDGTTSAAVTIDIFRVGIFVG